MVLHANLQSEMILTIFTILGGGGYHIILKVIMTKTRCLQFGNSQMVIFSKHGNVRGPKVVTLKHLSDCPGLETLTG